MNIKNNQKGFSTQGIVIIVALIVIAVVAYYAGTKNVVAPKGGDVVVNATSTVTDKPSITVLSPNGGETLKIGDTTNIRWNGGKNPLEIMVETYSEGELVASGWIDTKINPATGQYTWKVGSIYNTDSTGKKFLSTLPQGKYFIRVNDFKTGELDRSDSAFNVVSSVAQPTLTVLSPNGNENWAKGSTKTIRWSNPSTQTASGAGGPQDEISIFINSQPADTAPLLKTIVTGLNKNATSYDWVVGTNAENTVLNGQYYIKVCRKSFTCDWSDKPFIITSSAQPTITILSPNGGEVWKMGLSHDVNISVTGQENRTYGVLIGFTDVNNNPVPRWQEGDIKVGNTTISIPSTMATLTPGQYKISVSLVSSLLCANVEYCFPESSILSKDLSDRYITITN